MPVAPPVVFVELSDERRQEHQPFTSLLIHLSVLISHRRLPIAGCRLSLDS